MNADKVEPASFSKRLNDLYDPKMGKIEFQAPYKGSLGSYSAEIYCDTPGTANPVPRILDVVSSKLTSRSRSETTDADLIISRGVGGSQQAINQPVNQIIITSDSALQIFQKIMQEKFGIFDFGKQINHFFNESRIEYTEPYNGKLGSHPAEIYKSGGSECIYKILDLIEKINEPRSLTVKCSDTPEGADVLTSNAGCRGGIVQIVFTNTEAVEIFKSTMQKAFEDKAKKGSIDSNTLSRFANLYLNPK